MLSSSTINKVLSSSLLHSLYWGVTSQKLTKRQATWCLLRELLHVLQFNSRDCPVFQGFEFSFPRFFCFFVCCIFCYNHSFQNRNCVFDEALGLLIRFKLYVLKTEFRITYIRETMIFSSIMHIDNLHIILIKRFFISKNVFWNMNENDFMTNWHFSNTCLTLSLF